MTPIYGLTTSNEKYDTDASRTTTNIDNGQPTRSTKQSSSVPTKTNNTNQSLNVTNQENICNNTDNNEMTMLSYNNGTIKKDYNVGLKLHDTKRDNYLMNNTEKSKNSQINRNYQNYIGGYSTSADYKEKPLTAFSPTKGNDSILIDTASPYNKFNTSSNNESNPKDNQSFSNEQTSYQFTNPSDFYNNSKCNRNSILFEKSVYGSVDTNETSAKYNKCDQVHSESINIDTKEPSSNPFNQSAMNLTIKLNESIGTKTKENRSCRGNQNSCNSDQKIDLTAKRTNCSITEQSIETNNNHPDYPLDTSPTRSGQW